MGITTPERSDQGKHLTILQSLHLKPLLLLVVLLATCNVALAQDAHIHRCIGENGEPTFSDQKCSALRAAPETEAPSTTQGQPGFEHFSTIIRAAPFVTQTCAVSAQDLRIRVETAFNKANAVGLSGLFLWSGYGQGSAIAALRDLARLIREPLISIDLDTTLQFREPDRYRDREERYSGDELVELIIRTVGQQDRNVPFESVRRYQIREKAGCWWLLMPG